MIKMVEALSWLNQYGTSHLSADSQSWVNQMVTASNSDVRNAIDRALAASKGAADPLDYPEVLVNSAAVKYLRGWLFESGRHLKEAKRIYKGLKDAHRYALALWMLGIVYWKLSENNRAYRVWKKARDIFDDLYKARRVRARKEWYGKRIKWMSKDLACKPEEILTWLNYFEPSQLTISEREIVENIKVRIMREGYPKIHQLIEVLKFIGMQTTSNLARVVDTSETAEAFLECGFAKYQTGDWSNAIVLLKRAVEYYRPSSHQQMVARWMLGAIQWHVDSEQKQAVLNWEQCLKDIGELKTWADYRNKKRQKKWYLDTNRIMEKALKEHVSRYFS